MNILLSDLQQPILSERLVVQQLKALLLAALITTLLSGCAAFSGSPKRLDNLSINDLSNNEKLSKKFGALTEITECVSKKADEALTCRNKFITTRMYVIDMQFLEFEQALFEETRTSGYAVTLTTLGLTSAAAFATGGASQILSGIAAFIIGGREAFQKELLAERQVTAIHTAMRAGRAQVRVKLLDGLRQPIGEYPLEFARTHLNEYYDAGTILGALIGITETASMQVKMAKEDEAILLKQPLSKRSFDKKPTDLRNKMQTKLNTISSDNAIELVKEPPTPINEDMLRTANKIDSFNRRRSDGKVAKAVLRRWLSNDDIKVEDYPKWAKALGVSHNDVLE